MRGGGAVQTRTAAAPRLLLALPLLGAPLCSSPELVANGDFGSGATPAVAAAGANPGSITMISGADVFSFPGSKTTALQMMPGAAVTVTGATADHTKVGWYQVQFFAWVHASYSGSTAAVSVDVLADDTVVSLHEHGIPLRSTRGEWLHYSEWVPCNR